MALAGETAGTVTALLRRFLTFIFGGEKRLLTPFHPRDTPDTVSSPHRFIPDPKDRRAYHQILPSTFELRGCPSKNQFVLVFDQNRTPRTHTELTWLVGAERAQLCDRCLSPRFAFESLANVFHFRAMGKTQSPKRRALRQPASSYSWRRSGTLQKLSITGFVRSPIVAHSHREKKARGRRPSRPGFFSPIRRLTDIVSSHRSTRRRFLGELGTGTRVGFCASPCSPVACYGAVCRVPWTL